MTGPQLVKESAVHSYHSCCGLVVPCRAVPKKELGPTVYSQNLPKSAKICHNLSIIQWNRTTTGWWFQHISTLPWKVFVILDHPPKLRKHGGKNEASLRLWASLKTSIWKHCNGNDQVISKACTLVLASAATWPSANILPATHGPQHAVWPQLAGTLAPCPFFSWRISHHSLSENHIISYIYIYNIIYHKFHIISPPQKKMVRPASSNKKTLRDSNSSDPLGQWHKPCVPPRRSRLRRQRTPAGRIYLIYLIIYLLPYATIC